MNIAARLEALAEPGGICVSRTVVNHVKGKIYGIQLDMGYGVQHRDAPRGPPGSPACRRSMTMKSLGKVALVGVSGLVLFKLSTALFFPMFGLLMALVALAVKVAVVVAIGYFVMEWLKKDKHDDVEVHEVEVEDVEIEVE